MSRSAFSGHAFRWFPKADAVAFLSTFMKKPNRPDHLRETSRRSQADCQKKEGRWEFTASQSLFSLGATDKARRVAYRTATGELRFLPT